MGVQSSINQYLSKVQLGAWERCSCNCVKLVGMMEAEADGLIDLSFYAHLETK